MLIIVIIKDIVAVSFTYQLISYHSSHTWGMKRFRQLHDYNRHRDSTGLSHPEIFFQAWVYIIIKYLHIYTHYIQFYIYLCGNGTFTVTNRYHEHEDIP